MSNSGPWSITIGSIQVQVGQGDITNEISDAIVNSTNDRLDLSIGEVSGAIVRHGGALVQNECAAIAKRNGIKDGLAVTSGGNLPCKYIYHLVLGEEEKNWKNEIVTCLTRADLGKLSSISFPLLGTGVMGNSAKTMTGIILDAFLKFSKKATTLRTIRIIIFQKSMVQEFANAMHAKASEQKGLAGKARGVVSHLTGQDRKPEMEIEDLPPEIFSSFSRQNCFGIDAVETEHREKLEQEIVQMISLKKIQWVYEEGEFLRSYPPEVNLIIEMAHASDAACAEWETADEKFQLDFKQEKVFKVGYAADGIRVYEAVGVRVCRLPSGYQLPNTWVKMNPDEKKKRVKLTRNDAEWKTVETLARQTGQSSLNQILSIERIQNPALYKQYSVCKDHMQRSLAPGSTTVVERDLWHGTSVDTLESIELSGFDRSYCGKNATVYGRGVYFANCFRYSADNKYAVPDPNTGYKYVYLAKALTGEYVQGNQACIARPRKSVPTATSEYYDSVVDNVQNPNIFVIFRDVQSYPEYLITFT